MEILVSTDVLGFFGGPKDLSKAYGLTKKILESKGLAFNLEIIGWKHVFKQFLKLEKIYDYKVLGVHGKMGNFPLANIKARIIVKAMNDSLIDNRQLTEINIEKGYVLIHESEVENYDYKECSSILMVENNPSSGSLGRTAKYVKALNKSFKTGIMVDLVHTIKEKYQVKDLDDIENFSECFLGRLTEIREVTEDIELVGFHVSIGDNHDSLPINKMGKNDWMKFAELLKYLGSRCQYLVLENQYNLSKYFLFNKDSDYISTNTARIIEILADCEVIR